MADHTPILFIHYGPSAYLRETLSGALRSNPGKEVHFLGDPDNRSTCPRGVHFHAMSDHSQGTLLSDFRKVFQPISGELHRFNKRGGVEHWLRFVFERWFIIREFIESRNLSRFWTFDSDTLIACDLASREHRFAGVPATEQCRGCCLNGLINDSSVVVRYTDMMVELFRDDDYLAAQRERLKIHRGLAFNEMDAWQTCRDRLGIPTMALGQPIDGEAFDDALGIPWGFVPASRKVRDRIPLKKVLVDQRGAAWALRDADQSPVRLLTLNLSWLPDHFYRRLLPACRPLGHLAFDPGLCRELNLDEPSFLEKLLQPLPWL
ncbi:MAG: hypothetical protein Fur0032_01860 [Terrimicrobiaceae bacterium]